MSTKNEIKAIHLVDDSGKVHVVDKFNEDATWIRNPAYFYAPLVQVFHLNTDGTLTPMIVRNEDFLKDGGKTMCTYAEHPIRYDENKNIVPLFK